jgi:hypothetical protein
MSTVGIAMAVGAAVVMLWNPADATPLIVIGVVFIAVGARNRRTQQ